MDEHKKALITNLSNVDAAIQKILWVQFITLIVYGVLFFDGLEIKRQTDVLQSESQTIDSLLTRFVWFDSLSTIFVRYPDLINKYQITLEQFRNQLYSLQRIESSSPDYDTLFNYFYSIDPKWRDVRSHVFVYYISKLAQQGGKVIDQQLKLTNQLRRPQLLDSLPQAVTIRKSLEPLPSLIDTLQSVINDVYPEALTFHDPLRGLPDFLKKHNHPQQLPPLSSVEKAITDVTLFTQKHDRPSDNLIALKDFQKELADSIHAKEQQKGKINLTIIQQPVSVKLAFNFGLPVLVFFNHLLLLFLRKKQNLHRNFISRKSYQEKNTEPNKSYGSSLSIHLSPTFLNFLFTRDTSTPLKAITWSFFYLLEIAVGLLGFAIFWYLLKFLPIAERSSFVILILTGMFLLIHVVQVIYIYVRTGKMSS